MQWICSVCGYIHEDEEPPDYCFECGAPGKNFTEWSDDDEVVTRNSYSDDFDDMDIDLDEDADDDDEAGGKDEEIDLDDYN